MAISKIKSGINDKDQTASSGSDVANAVNALIDNSHETTKDFGLSAGAVTELQTEKENVESLNPAEYGRLMMINGRNSAVSIFDLANFSGQTSGAGAPIGFLFHHYTDGKAVQIDNVGSSPALTIKNARNPSRRSDKPSDYVGTGRLIDLIEDNGAGSSILGFYVSKDFEFTWTGNSGGTRGIANLVQLKTDDGQPAYQIRTANAHDRFLSMFNGPNEILRVTNDVTKTRLLLASRTSQTSGMYIRSDAGPLALEAATEILINTQVRSNTGRGNLQLGAKDAAACVQMQKPMRPSNYIDKPSLPSAADFLGCWASLAGIPIYSDGTNWKYFRDDSIV